MKTAFVGFAAAAVVQAQPSPTGKTSINDQDLIDQYNSMNGASWVAGRNAFFDGMTFDDARPLMGTGPEDISEHLQSTLPDSVYAAMSDPPADFDSRSQWSGLIHPVRNQMRCGSCWAFSAAEVLSDRVAIATKKASPSLSPEDMVSCDKTDMGCKGGTLPNAWSYLKNTGIVTDKCMPYAAGNGTAPACPTKCVSASDSFTRQKASSAYAINGVANMQKEIMTNGPIQVAFLVYKSFMSYKSGVYSKHFWELLPEGGHAVKVVGWGTESGTDYWLVANSWDTTWGLDGFFKIKRGTNECKLETQGPPYAGMPATSLEVDSVPSEIEKLFCKVASLKMIEDKAAGMICAEIEKKVPSVPAAKCQAFVEAGWEKLVAKCPKEVVEVAESPCCQGACKVAGEEKYYSVAKSLFGTKHCGECCMNPSKYNLYHIFEKNLTKADNDSPCAKTFGYTKYDSTATHGFGPVKMTLDLYDMPSEVVV